MLVVNITVCLERFPPSSSSLPAQCMGRDLIRNSTPLGLRESSLPITVANTAGCAYKEVPKENYTRV